MIVHDNCGAPIGALSMLTSLVQFVVELEALACQQVIQFALEIGLSRVVVEGDSVVVEGDSIVVINALLNGTGKLASYGNILDDIRVQASAFQCVDFIHVSRVCNFVADALAKKASFILGL